MKVYLDDVRPCPHGWVPAYTAWEAIALLETVAVTHLSLDYDLGDNPDGVANPGCGYDVVLWLEEQVLTNDDFVMPVVTAHSANPVGRLRMAAGLRKIKEIYEGR